MTTSGSYNHSSGPTTNLILCDDGSTLQLYFDSAGDASSIYSTTTSLGNLTTGECAPAEVHDGEAERGGTVEQRFSMWTSGASGLLRAAFGTRFFMESASRPITV